MDATTIAAIVLGSAVPVVFVGLMLVIKRSNDQAHQRRAEGAERRGWTYQRGTGNVLFRLEGIEESIPWEVEAQRSQRSGQSGTSHSSTHFTTPAEQSDGVVLLGPKLPPFLAKMNFGGSLVQMLLQHLLGEEASDLSDLSEVQVGSAPFRENFTVLASSRELAETFVVDEAQQTLLDWVRQGRSGEVPVIFRWKNRLQIRVREAFKDPKDLEALVELGVTLARQCGY
ncbi:MAG: hypothetical protein HN348_16350 [Proteobacteria bacterium]|jgi:hypothetical protein|nr:hypothetical protein [Pseudomonadota bacterium]